MTMLALFVVSLLGFLSLCVGQANSTAMSTSTSLSCSIGSKDCSCRPDGSCNDPLQCIREVGLCACVLGSVGCACVDNACPKGGECVDNLCEVAGLPSFVIPVAIVGGIVVLLAVVLVVVIVIRRKKADDGAMHAFNHSGANSGFGGTAPAFLSSSPSFYDPSPPPPTDFMQRSTSYDNPSTFSSPPTTFGSPPPTFGSPPPPPLSQQPSYVGHIYGGSPAADTSTVGFSSARGSHGQYSNIPASLAAS